jgi:hypothetical protein|tara:strand:- start:449 stop:619 length:171 start_codon:yes stop_codon:yes gene_type:complete
MDPLAIIFMFCGTGLAYTSYTIGIKEGAKRMLDKLEEIKIVNVDKDGAVTPNCGER